MKCCSGVERADCSWWTELNVPAHWKKVNIVHLKLRRLFSEEIIHVNTFPKCGILLQLSLTVYLGLHTISHFATLNGFSRQICVKTLITELLFFVLQKKLIWGPWFFLYTSQICQFFKIRAQITFSIKWLPCLKAWHFLLLQKKNVILSAH